MKQLFGKTISVFLLLTVSITGLSHACGCAVGGSGAEAPTGEEAEGAGENETE